MPATTGIGNGTQVLDIPLNKITEAPSNVRTVYDQTELEELGASILQHGLLQPISVYGGPEAGGDGTYAVFMGFRRYRALRWLSETKQIKATEPVRCVVDNDAHSGGELSGTGTARQLIENLQRVDISAIDEARGYQRMIEQYGYKQRDLAATVGKSAGHIAKRVALLTLPEDVQALVGEKIEIDQAYRLSRLDEDDIKRITKNVVNGGQGSQISYDIDQAERTQERRKRSEKFAKALAKAMIEPIEDSAIEDRNRLEFIGHFDIDTLSEYEPKKNHVVAWSLGIAKDSIRVYRKLTAKQIEARDRQRIEEIEQADAEEAQAQAEWLENEATPKEKWEFEVQEIEDAYDEALGEWSERAANEYGTVLKDTDVKGLQRLIVGLALSHQPTAHYAQRACETLGITVPTEDADGNELMNWHRPFQATLKEWIDGDSQRALQAYLACNTNEQVVAQHPAFKGVLAAIEANGIVMPEKPELPPEPWFDPVDGEWVTTDDRRLDDGTSEPVREDFDSDEEYEAAVEVFLTAFHAEQAEYADSAS